MAGYYQGTSTTNTWTQWTYNTATTTGTNDYLVWDRWNGTAATTATTSQIAIREPFQIWVDEETEIRQLRTVEIDGNGRVVRHPTDLTREQKEDAERAWRAFVRTQPDYEQRRLQRERAREQALAPMRYEVERQRMQAQIEMERQRMEAQRAQFAEQERVYAAKLKAAEEERKAAEARAEKLLVENLSLKQKEEYQQHKHIIVHGRNARYRIRKGRSINIDEIDRSGKITRRLCAYPSHTIPDYDTMLAQKLMLEVQEDEFLKIAIPHQPIQRDEVVLPVLQ